MFVECAAIAFLRGEFQGRKDIRDEVTLHEFPKRQIRKRRNLAQIQRTKMFLGTLSRLPPSELRDIAENCRFPPAPDSSVRIDTVCPPLQFPYRIAFATFAQISLLITSASHLFLPAS